MDRRKTNNSNQASRKRRRKLSSSQEKDESTNVAYHTDGNATQTTSTALSATAQARQWNVIDRVLDASKYDKDQKNESSLGLYELCRDWIYAGTTLNESIRLSENVSQEKAKLLALNASHEDEKSSPNDKKSNECINNLPGPVQTSTEPITNTEIEELNKKLEKTVRQTQMNDLEIVNSLKVDDQMTQTHALLKLHVNRWKTVRQEWNLLYKKSNARYIESENILKSIFEELQ